MQSGWVMPKKEEIDALYLKNLESMRKPVVAVVYEPSHGTYHTDMAIKMLCDRGLYVVKIFPEGAFDDLTGELNCALLSRPDLINGLLLPGGNDVITDKTRYTHREKLETLFMDLSMQHKIPTLGICRGHQFVGHYFGAEIKNISFDHGNDVLVVPDVKSTLYKLACKKYESPKNMTEIKRNHTAYYYTLMPCYEYSGACLHTQGVYFQQWNSKGVYSGKWNYKVKITSLNKKDKLPESMQVEDHVLTFQHHHESRAGESRLARAVFKQFAQMVTAFHNQKHPDTEYSNQTSHNENRISYSLDHYIGCVSRFFYPSSPSQRSTQPRRLNEIEFKDFLLDVFASAGLCSEHLTHFTVKEDIRRSTYAPFVSLMRMLLIDKRLPPEEAIHQMNNLNCSQVFALIACYGNGLRGDHLRNWQQGEAEEFSQYHYMVLKWLIEEKDCEPSLAVRLLDHLNFEDEDTLKEHVMRRWQDVARVSFTLR